MPLLNQKTNNERSEMIGKWYKVRSFVREKFKQTPNIDSILFLIGMNEIGQFRAFEKEEKQDLMHVALCTLFEPEGYYIKTHLDKDGWPHFREGKALPGIGLREQQDLIKQKIIHYFEQQELI